MIYIYRERSSIDIYSAERCIYYDTGTNKSASLSIAMTYTCTHVRIHTMTYTIVRSHSRTNSFEVSSSLDLLFFLKSIWKTKYRNMSGFGKYALLIRPKESLISQSFFIIHFYESNTTNLYILAGPLITYQLICNVTRKKVFNRSIDIIFISRQHSNWSDVHAPKQEWLICFMYVYNHT